MLWHSIGAEGTVALVVAVGVAVGAIVVGRRWASALAELSGAMEALGQGRPIRPIRSRAGGPAGRLARAFDASATRVQARVARLERDLQQLQAVLSGMAEGVIAVDPRRRLLFANESADRLFGLGPAAVGRLVAELIRSPQVQEAVEATLAGPGPYRCELTLPGREALGPAPARVLAVLGTLLPGEPPAGAVLVFHDVTDLRRLERMRQDFVANASHELKTPLASIKAYTETLLDWALHDEKVNVRFLRQIAEQADRLDRLILDMLSLARLDAGQEPFRHGPLVLAPAVRACAESHRDRAEAKGLQYRLDLECIDEEALVTADEEAIRQILDNLIDNALKYTPAGGWVRVACRVAGEEVVLEVADSGIGIPRDDLPRVFERFYRVDTARSRELGGTGLGLAIVKHVVQSIGGKIGVSSRVGAGTQFAVHLPRARPPTR